MQLRHIPAFGLFVILAGVAQAQTLDLPDRVTDQIIFDACRFTDTSVTISPDAVQRHDLTGDGTADLVISGAGVTCQDGSPTRLCRPDGLCTAWIFYEGTVDGQISPLALHSPFYGRDLFIVKGPPPRIRAQYLGDRIFIVWRDGEFRVDFTQGQP